MKRFVVLFLLCVLILCTAPVFSAMSQKGQSANDNKPGNAATPRGEDDPGGQPPADRNPHNQPPGQGNPHNQPPAQGNPHKPRPPIYNQVFTLLDHEVVLSTEEDSGDWESEAFDTSQFNRVGLRVSADTEEGSVTCRVCWQFSSDDECLDGIPMVSLHSPINLYPPIVDPEEESESAGLAPDGARDERPDGVPDLYAPSRSRWLYPPGSPYSPYIDFAEVRGLQAKVRCSLGLRWGDFGFVVIGDDQSLLEDPLEEPDVSISLTDVKVLLRRE